MTENSKVAIRSIVELEKLAHERIRFWRTGNRVEISLELTDLYGPMRSVYERRLSDAYSECGCSWAAAAGFTNLALLFIAFTFFGVTLSWVVILTIAICFSILVMIGKGAGLLLSRLKFRLLVKEIVDAVVIAERHLSEIAS